jgi:general secretion pathway protein A
MYQHHFGLRAEPFAVTPDPTFLFTGRAHREALAALVYGVKQRRGFICLVGEIGTGKTTLLRALLEDLDVSVRTLLITHTTIGCDDLHRMILHELSIPHGGLTRAEMVHALYEFLLAEFQAGHPPPLLIVDEAQNLAEAVLEEIRLLTNLEIGESKLLQVILAGQPELERKLRRPGLRQLDQRIAVRARLLPLNQDETAAYVRHRLRVAGSRDPHLFNRAALRAVWARTNGVPRLVNILGEQALVNAFGADKRGVNEKLVEEAARDLGLHRPPTSEARAGDGAGLPAEWGRWSLRALFATGGRR